MENATNNTFPIFAFLLDIRGWVEALIRASIIIAMGSTYLWVSDIRLASHAELGTEYQEMEPIPTPTKIKR